MDPRRCIALFVCTAAFACGDLSGTHVMCECALGGVTVLVPDSLHATAFRVVGDACSAEHVSCAGVSTEDEHGLCEGGQYLIRPTQVGSCHIEVDLDTQGTFARDVRFEHSDGCCAGIYPVDGDWTVTVEAS